MFATDPRTREVRGRRPHHSVRCPALWYARAQNAAWAGSTVEPSFGRVCTFCSLSSTMWLAGVRFQQHEISLLRFVSPFVFSFADFHVHRPSHPFFSVQSAHQARLASLHLISSSRSSYTPRGFPPLVFPSHPFFSPPILRTRPARVRQDAAGQGHRQREWRQLHLCQGPGAAQQGAAPNVWFPCGNLKRSGASSVLVEKLAPWKN